MPLQDYKPGTVCWAKLKGFPWWPARIETEADLNDEVLAARPRSSRIHPVLFFGTLDYGWIGPEALQPFQKFLKEFSNRSKRDESFSKAVEQALNPELAEEVIAKAKALEEEMEQDLEDEEVILEQEESEVESDHSERRNRRKSSKRKLSKKEPRTPKSKKKPLEKSSTKSRKKRDPVDDEILEAASASPVKKKQKIEKEQPAREPTPPPEPEPQSPKNESVEENPSEVTLPQPEKAEPEIVREPSVEKTSTAVEEEEAQSKKRQLITAQDKILLIRHKLQKLLLKESIGDLRAVHQLFCHVEEFPMTIDVLRETKIGKLMHKVSRQTIDDDTYSIPQRAFSLTKKWKALLMEETDKNGANPQVSESMKHDSSSNEQVNSRESSHEKVLPEENLPVQANAPSPTANGQTDPVSEEEHTPPPVNDQAKPDMDVSQADSPSSLPGTEPLPRTDPMELESLPEDAAQTTPIPDVDSTPSPHTPSLETDQS